jgi:hypothetical protein
MQRRTNRWPRLLLLLLLLLVLLLVLLQGSRSSPLCVLN